MTPTRRTLGPPRIFVEVTRQIEGTDQIVCCRHEIDLEVWLRNRVTPHVIEIVLNTINAQLEQAARYDQRPT